MQEWLIWGAVLALCSLLAVEGQAQELPYGIGKWPEAMGNHRVRVKVSEGGDAVRAHLPWRCRGRNPQAKAVLAVDAATGREIAHTAVIEVNREYGDIAFQPISGPDEYYLYYLPYTANPINHAYQITYAAPRDTAEAAWLQKHGLGKARLAEGRWKSLPEAQPLEIQARGEFHRFDPVEVIATAEKTKRLLSAHASEPFLLFPEDHRYPIRMTDELPLRWIQSGPSQSFRGEACRNEFYVFRIGVYAFSRELNSLQGTFEDLKSTQGGIVPASALRCFNLGGSDFAGHAFRKTVSVERGKIQALWLGVQVPRDAAPGSYEGRFTLQPEGERAAQVKLTLDVSDRTLEDCGDIDLWRPSRLRWLDSAIASMRMWRIPLRL